MKKILFVLALAATAAAVGSELSDLKLKAKTDKDNPIDYKVGETIRFDFSLDGVKELPEEAAAKAPLKVKWTRTGDDGRTEKGEKEISLDKGFSIETKLDVPGIVRLEAQLVGSDGKRFDAVKVGKWEKGVQFHGGAGAETEKMKMSTKEPADFDAFWARQRKELAKVPVKAKRWEVKSPNDKVRLYAVEIDCAGGNPVTGYISIPKRCDGGQKLGAIVGFDGYGAGKPRAPQHCWYEWQINLHINAHGCLLEKDDAYYRQFFDSIKSNGKGYALDPVQNADPEKAYFRGMALRVMRALEYVESLPEWNGKDLEVSGGSQGGLQSVWGAALDPKVTKATVNIVWCCDIGKRGEGRMKSEFEPSYTPALRYFDCANMARRIKCDVHINRAGLGDYTSPPSGITVFYNNLVNAKSRKIDYVQGSRHGYIPPKK